MIPSISIIVPVYNGEATLQQCVDSILSQPFKNFELLLIDDGSTDETPTICDEYANVDSRVKVIHKKNGGVSSARNIGLDEAKGRWITFIDSDDYIENGYIRDLSDLNVDIILCRYNNLVGDKFESSFVIQDSPKISLGKIISKYLSNSLFRAPWAKFYKKVLIDNIRFPEDMKVGEDTCFIFQYLSKCNSLCLLTSDAYIVRISKNSDEVKYAISVNYAIKSLTHLKDAFELLNKAHHVGKDKFLSYISYFKCISKCDWENDPNKWYKNKYICELYKYIWVDLSFVQKAKIQSSFILRKWR